MDETGVVIAAVTVTATTVGAFWLRTESIRDEIRKWVDEKYMTREATNLRFESIQAMLRDQGNLIFDVRKEVKTMEGRQRIQIQYLRNINSALGNRRLPERAIEDEEDNGTE